MQETQVQSLGQEDMLEKGKSTHSSVLACKIPQTEEPGGLYYMGSQKSYTTERLTLSLFIELSNFYFLQYISFKPG